MMGMKFRAKRSFSFEDEGKNGNVDEQVERNILARLIMKCESCRRQLDSCELKCSECGKQNMKPIGVAILVFGGGLLLVIMTL